MPGRWGQVGIVGFWLVMMGWLAWRDLVPRLGMGELRYRAVLADRARFAGQLVASPLCGGNLTEEQVERWLCAAG